MLKVPGRKGETGPFLRTGSQTSSSARWSRYLLKGRWLQLTVPRLAKPTCVEEDEDVLPSKSELVEFAPQAPFSRNLLEEALLENERGHEQRG